MKVGIFGGRFDPPHFGHLLLCRDLVEGGFLDEVRFLVNYHPPHKKAYASYYHRVRMVEILLRDEEKLKVDTFEGDMGISPSYTYEVLKLYGEKHPKDEIFFVLGADQMVDIKTWKNYRELPSLAKFLVLARGNFQIPEDIMETFKPVIVRHRLVEISSSEIRERLFSGKSVKGLTSEGVIEYIHVHGLYSKPQSVEVFVDGSSLGNPGLMRAAFVVLVNGKKVYEEIEELGEGTNNEAEYYALFNALSWLKDNSIFGARVYMDSMLVVNQVKGSFKLRAENLRDLNAKCKQLLLETSSILEYIPRKSNLADAIMR
ncbi:MAG: nicotinate (nicotinamide) nucleotide adenylyltransferase [candidate division WOR-3 bacterium]